MEEKSKPLSIKQKETLIEFVHSRPEMYKGAFSATYTYAMSVTLWKFITDVLNSIPGGARKEWKQWRKTFIDIKKNVKSKVAKQKKHMEVTGGGPPLPPMSEDNIKEDNGTEKLILDMISPVALSGNPQVPEPVFILEEIEVFDVNESASQEWESEDLCSTLANYSHIEVERVKSPGPSKSFFKSVPLEPSKKQKNNDICSPKRMTKSRRLTESLRNNQDFLTLSQNGITSTDAYRREKLEILKTQAENERRYHKEKLEILRDISHSFRGIARNLDVSYTNQ